MVFPTNSTEAIPFTEYLEDKNTQLYYLHKKDSIDIGLIPLRHRHENQIKGETFITEIHYRNLPSKYTGCILIGFPSSHEKFEANFINLNPAYVLVRRILDNRFAECWHRNRQLICGTRLETGIPVLVQRFGLC